MLKPQPYNLKNTIQQYQWGTKGKNAFIPKLLKIKAEKDKPYAELWMGAHPKASSKIVVDGKQIDLLKAIEQHPIELLGRRTAKNFSNKLPFLFKVLSINQPLSIQVHPNKRQAIALHKKDQVNYPDSNHKHEIAIALDKLIAFVGFKPANQIVKTLNEFPEIAEFIGLSRMDAESIVKSLIKKSLTDKKELAYTIAKINGRILAKTQQNEIEKYFIKLYKVYDTDLGLLLIFFLNFVHLKKGEAIFTKPGLPHAYLKGNVLECMSNSDNVIRAGLTSKHKDIETVLKVLDYQFNKPKVIKALKCGSALVYKTDAKEFELHLFDLRRRKLLIENILGPRILLVLKGEIVIQCLNKNKNQNILISKGESVFLPPSLASFKILSAKLSQFVLVAVPKEQN